MKHKIIELIAFILFIGSLGYIFGTMGNLQLDYITLGQAFKKGCIGLVVLGADVLLINYLGKEEDR